jgi:hypothetical protein
MTRQASWSASLARTYAAWERFAAGDEHPEGVPLGIATSWHRCRDVYRIDPRRAPSGAVEDDSLYGAAHATLFAELGALAASLTARHGDCLATVTDGRGHLVAFRGRGPSGRRARDTGLVPASRWGETTAGTNAIGTALVSRRGAGVCGPEHWNSALHDWSCTSVALCDALTGTPLATVTVSAWRDVVPVRPVDLLVETRPLAGVLRACAARDRARILAAYSELERHGTVALAALDASGRVVAANAAFRARRVDAATSGDDTGDVDLADLARRVRARAAPGTSGAPVAEPSPDGACVLVPVMSGPEPVGFLAAVGPGPADRPVAAAPAAAEVARARVPALTDTGQVVLLPAATIRHARADGHTVWLTTDEGVLRATRRGIDALEHDLAGAGFLRVHRSYLVNLARVREVTPERDGLTLSTAPRRHERIPVSRRCAPRVRRSLGL